MNRLLTTVALSTALAVTTAACGGTTQPRQSSPARPQPAAEQEDCDLDDIIERDTDCGFAKKKASIKKPPTYKPRSSYKRPAKRSSYRRTTTRR